jgi:hypothetical protein
LAKKEKTEIETDKEREKERKKERKRERKCYLAVQMCECVGYVRHK